MSDERTYSARENYNGNFYVPLLQRAGITNGIDDDEWDPSSDEHIDYHYSAEDLSGKVTKSLLF